MSRSYTGPVRDEYSYVAGVVPRKALPPGLGAPAPERRIFVLRHTFAGE